MKMTTINDITSAIGAETKTPSTPKDIGKTNTNGTLKTKSRSKDKPIDNIGLPNDCRKMLVAFWIQHKRIVPR